MKLVKNPEYYWTYEDWDGEVIEIHRDTKESAQEYADKMWLDHCLDMEDCEEIMEAEITLIRFFYDEDTGDMVEVERVKSGVMCIEYDDFAEHNTLWH